MYTNLYPSCIALLILLNPLSMGACHGYTSRMSSPTNSSQPSVLIVVNDQVHSVYDGATSAMAPKSAHMHVVGKEYWKSHSYAFFILFPLVLSLNFDLAQCDAMSTEDQPPRKDEHLFSSLSPTWLYLSRPPHQAATIPQHNSLLTNTSTARPTGPTDKHLACRNPAEPVVLSLPVCSPPETYFVQVLGRPRLCMAANTTHIFLRREARWICPRLYRRLTEKPLDMARVTEQTCRRRPRFLLTGEWHHREGLLGVWMGLHLVVKMGPPISSGCLARTRNLLGNQR